jgi:hypothetical protein
MTISYRNLAEDVKEWTALLDLSETPTGMDTPRTGTTHQFWKNSCGFTVYETFSLAGVGHAVPFDGNAVAAFFGLDRAGGQDPETAACPGAMPGGGAGGGGGGPIGTGGAPGAGGMGGGRAGGTGGSRGDGGSAGGSGNRGGSGLPSTGTGGSTGSGGAAPRNETDGGNMPVGTGGRPPTDAPMPGGAGCACALGAGAASSTEGMALLIATLGLLLRGRRSRRRPGPASFTVDEATRTADMLTDTGRRASMDLPNGVSMAWYDAFADPMIVNGVLAEERVQELAEALGSNYRRS